MKARCGGWSHSGLVGLTIARTVVSDEELKRLTINDLPEYRTKAADVYKMWSANVDGLAVRISEIPPERADEASWYSKGTPRSLFTPHERSSSAFTDSSFVH